MLQRKGRISRKLKKRRGGERKSIPSMRATQTKPPRPLAPRGKKRTKENADRKKNRGSQRKNLTNQQKKDGAKRRRGVTGTVQDGEKRIGQRGGSLDQGGDSRREGEGVCKKKGKGGNACEKDREGRLLEKRKKRQKTKTKLPRREIRRGKPEKRKA